MKKVFIMLVIIAVVILSGCSNSNGSLNNGGGWQSINAGNIFSFDLPLGFEKVNIQGIDSFVGQYVYNPSGGSLPKYYSDRMVVFFDYGQYSGSLEGDENNEEYWEINKGINGKAAKIVGYKRAGVHDGSVYTSAVHIVSDDGNGLTLRFDYNNPEEKDIALRVFDSITFN